MDTNTRNTRPYDWRYCRSHSCVRSSKGPLVGKRTVGGEAEGEGGNDLRREHDWATMFGPDCYAARAPLCHNREYAEKACIESLQPPGVEWPWTGSLPDNDAAPEPLLGYCQPPFHDV